MRRVAAVALAAPGLAVVALTALGAGGGTESRERVAVSPDGRFELVALRGGEPGVRYRLRTVAVLLGREGRTDVACTRPGRTVVVGASVGDGEVTFRVDGGTEWTVPFDRATLVPSRLLNWCGRT